MPLAIIMGHINTSIYVHMPYPFQLYVAYQKQDYGSSGGTSRENLGVRGEAEGMVLVPEMGFGRHV